jgi:hypothetical protein
MKTPNSQPDDEMRPEYDFSKAVRGKNHKPLHQGYTVEVQQEDGATVVNHYKLIDGAVMLEPDVRAYFPDSESVNAALRSVIELAKHLPGGERYRQKDKSARQVGE